MPSPSASEVGQRRFWNNVPSRNGVISIGHWGSLAGSALFADGKLVYTGEQLDAGVLPFPDEFKTARRWKLIYNATGDSGSSVDWDGTNEWIFKPYSTDMDLVGPDSWMRGRDWRSANLFFDSSPFALSRDEDGHLIGGTTLRYSASSSLSDITGGYFPPTASGFGAGGLLYGYLNNVYFGNNEFGGGKENVGIGPKTAAVGDLSKAYSGFWGAIGISHGVATSPWHLHAEWEFDLCWRPEAAAMMSLNGQMAHLNAPNDDQTEGWGTDIVPVQDNTIDKEDGSSETYLQFTVDVSAARETMNVYTTGGKQLQYGTDYVHDSCDRSGRSYRLNDAAIPRDPCGGLYRLIVTYLVQAATLSRGKRSPRETDTNVGHDRLAGHDIRGL